MIVFLKSHQVFKWIVETATGSWVVFLVQEGIKWLSEMESDLDVMGSSLANTSLLRWQRNNRAPSVILCTYYGDRAIW